METAVSIIARIRKAHEQSKVLVAVLDKHNAEVTSTSAIIQVVKDESALRTASVGASLSDVKATADKLVSFLKSLDPTGKSTGRQFMHQLISGSKDEEALANIMTDLGRAKQNLTLHLQAANVGLTRTVGDRIQADTVVIHRIDKLLQDILGGGNGLKIVEMLKSSQVHSQFHRLFSGFLTNHVRQWHGRIDRS